MTRFDMLSEQVTMKGISWMKTMSHIHQVGKPPPLDIPPDKLESMAEYSLSLPDSVEVLRSMFYSWGILATTPDTKQEVLDANDWAALHRWGNP